MKKNKGQSIFEVILALGLIALVLLSIVAVAGISVKNSSFSKNNTLAVRYSEEALEWIKQQKEENWTDFYDNTQNSTWCLRSLSWNIANECEYSHYIPDTELKREVVFSNRLTTSVQATIKVYWTDAGGYHEAVSDTILTNWKEE